MSFWAARLVASLLYGLKRSTRILTLAGACLVFVVCRRRRGLAARVASVSNRSGHRAEIRVMPTTPSGDCGICSGSVEAGDDLAEEMAFPCAR